MQDQQPALSLSVLRSPRRGTNGVSLATSTMVDHTSSPVHNASSSPGAGEDPDHTSSPVFRPAAVSPLEAFEGMSFRPAFDLGGPEGHQLPHPLHQLPRPVVVGISPQNGIVGMISSPRTNRSPRVSFPRSAVTTIDNSFFHAAPLPGWRGHGQEGAGRPPGENAGGQQHSHAYVVRINMLSMGTARNS